MKETLIFSKKAVSFFIFYSIDHKKRESETQTPRRQKITTNSDCRQKFFLITLHRKTFKIETPASTYGHNITFHLSVRQSGGLQLRGIQRLHIAPFRNIHYSRQDSGVRRKGLLRRHATVKSRDRAAQHCQQQRHKHHCAKLLHSRLRLARHILHLCARHWRQNRPAGSRAEH